jgi:DNA-binding PadR family transcriptional regulator
MYELIILALLMYQPFHGYLIAKIINDIVGPYTRVSNGRLYPLLAKLEKEGFITFSSEGHQAPPKSRPVLSYRITPVGAERFYQLMMDVSSNPGDYQRLFNFKAGMLDLISFSDRLKLIDHYINYCHNQIFHIQSEKDDMEINEETRKQLVPVERIVEMMAHRLKQWQLELEWANHLRDQELARHERERDDSIQVQNPV